MSDPAIKLLIVTETLEATHEVTAMLVGGPEIAIVGVTSGTQEVLALADLHQPDVVVMDYAAPGANCAKVSRALLKDNAAIQIVMISATNEVGDIRKAMRAGARDYLIRPLGENELLETVRWLIRERREYARMQAFVGQLRHSYEALFKDDKPIPATVVAYLEEQVRQSPDDRLTMETLAVAYARNRDWVRLAPLVEILTARS